MATAAAAELVAASERAKALAAAVPVVLGQTGGQGHDDAAAESEMADSSSEVEEEAPTQPQPVEKHSLGGGDVGSQGGVPAG